MSKDAGAKRRRDPIPDEFPSLKAAGEFWDSHDTTEYEDVMKPVDLEVRVDRVTLVVDSEVARRLRAEARRRHLGVAKLASSLIRKGLAEAK